MSSQIMKIVGHHLQQEAIRRTSDAEKDVFGRSSYNRYYYAAFLTARSLFVSLDPGWEKKKHAEYPETLKGKIGDRFKKAKARASRIGDWELYDECERAKSAALQLAKLMQVSCATRVAADYNPGIKVIFNTHSGFELNSVAISDAYEWPQRADMFARKILQVWVQIND